MKLNEYLRRNERLEVERAISKTELLADIIPMSRYILFPTSQGRFFTCREFASSKKNKDETPWKEVEFDEISIGKCYPFN